MYNTNVHLDQRQKALLEQWTKSQYEECKTSPFSPMQKKKLDLR